MKIYLILFLAFVISGCGIGTGENGVHRGVITDVSYAGWFCKTWEGQIISGNGNAAIHYEFTISNLEAVEKLKAAQRNGEEVIIHYESPVIYSACSSKQGSFVSSVEPFEGRR